MQTAQIVGKPAKSSLAYLQLYDTESTVDQARWSLRGYFQAVTGSRPRTNADLDTSADEYFSRATEESVRDDVETFFISLRGKAPKTIQSRLSQIRTALRRNGFKFDEYFWRDLQHKVKGWNRVVTIDTVPTNEDLRKIVLQMPLIGKAIVLTAASSGARISEIVSLSLDDVNLSTDPIRLVIRGENSKEGGSRTVFASKEAKETLQLWIRARPGWLQAAVRKTPKSITRDGRSWQVSKDPNDPRLFPINPAAVRVIYNRALDKAGFLTRDPRSNFATLHFHTLRKLFKTRLGPVMPQDVVETLMGHEGYLGGAYRRYTIDQLAEHYRKAERVLWILSDTAPLAEEMEGLREENITLKARVDGLEKALVNYLAGYQKVNSQVKAQEIMPDEISATQDIEKLKTALALMTKRIEEMERKGSQE